MWLFKIALTSTLSIVILFLLCRLNGQRQISQMTTFDYINSITIGSIAAELATDLEAWREPLAAMVIYGLVTVGINKLNCASLCIRQFMNGKPVIIMKNGVVMQKALWKSNIDLNEFLTQCRVAGWWDLNQLEAVLLEQNGRFSFLPKAESRPATPEDLSIRPEEELLWHSLILDGVLQKENLVYIGKDEKWLNEQLRKQGLHKVEETFLALSDGQNGFFACPVQKKSK